MLILTIDPHPYMSFLALYLFYIASYYIISLHTYMHTYVLAYLFTSGRVVKMLVSFVVFSMLHLLPPKAAHNFNKLYVCLPVCMYVCMYVYTYIPAALARVDPSKKSMPGWCLVGNKRRLSLHNPYILHSRIPLTGS